MGVPTSPVVMEGNIQGPPRRQCGVDGTHNLMGSLAFLEVIGLTPSRVAQAKLKYVPRDTLLGFLYDFQSHHMAHMCDLKKKIKDVLAVHCSFRVPYARLQL